MLGEVEAAFSLWDRLKKKLAGNAAQATVASRFVYLFENHGVHRNQIPRFFGHGLSAEDVSTNEKLLAVLNEAMLQEAADLFAVNREWLDGADARIYEVHDFYKEPEKFAEFISVLLSRSDAVEGMLYKTKTRSHGYDAIIVIEEQIGWVGERPIYRHHLCGNWIFSYWKSRAYLTACIALAWKNSLYIHGQNAPVEWIKSMTEGTHFYLGIDDNIRPAFGEKWYPEDMCDNPTVYLDGVSEGNSGKSLALGLWLKLHDKGFMEAGFTEGNFRSAFETEQQKYKE